MKGKTPFQFFSIFVILAILIAGCAPVSAGAPEQAEMQKVTLLGPEEVTFEIPADWAFYGNAGYLSPDQGRTLLGVQQAWAEAGRDAAQLLLPPDSELTGSTSLQSGSREVTRYDLKVYRTKDGEKAFVGYERMYAFPSPDGAQMIGLLIRTEKERELDALEAVALHAVETFSMKPVERPVSRPELPEMQSFSVPGPEGIHFELPVDWQPWGNGFAWSPDDGQTLMGLNRAWVEEGKDARKPLLPEEGELLTESDLQVGEKAVHRADFKVYQINAAQGTKTFNGYEALYTFLSPDGTVMMAVLFIAPSEDALAALEPVMLQAVESFHME